ncbi:hypothetical protein [Streptomyces luteireticuli]|uniref:hypothetical protein n=1 Tax=Streptomyces luteireticuli TaxID=173858 RepID=UPI003557CFD6
MSWANDDGPKAMQILMLLYVGLQGDAPLRVDVAAKAEECGVTTEEFRAEVAWLVEHRFLALDGDVGEVLRLWVNPSVAFLPGTDPRVAAARHRFPYITTAGRGMKAGEPVAVHPYEPGLWEAVYDRQRDMFEDPPVFSHCGLHAQ